MQELQVRQKDTGVCPKLTYNLHKNCNCIFSIVPGSDMFRDNLDAEVWECDSGHGICGDCVDKGRIVEEEDEGGVGEDGVLRNRGFQSLRRILNEDENEDTLWLCTRDEDTSSESVTLTEKTRDDEEQDTIWRFRNQEDGSTEDNQPKTMSQVVLKDVAKTSEEEQKKYMASLRKNIKTMEFFDIATSAKETNIGAYGDYNTNFRNVFDSYSIDEDEWNKAYEVNEEVKFKTKAGSSSSSLSSSSSSSSNYSTDTELEIDPVTRCPVCNLAIKQRNSEIEKIAVLFNKMMSHRLKM